MVNSEKNTKILPKKSMSAYSKKQGARAVALSVIKEVVCANQDTQNALDKALLQETLSTQDKRLCTELVYGAIRQKIRIDWFLRSVLSNPERLPIEIILALEIALYEFFFLRIPAHASFDEAVSFAKQSYGKKIAGLVNAVLRTAQRQEALFFDINFYKVLNNTISNGISKSSDKHQLIHGNENKILRVKPSVKDILYREDSVSNGSDALDAFARLCSMPIWIARRWSDAYGQEKTRSYLLAASKNAPIGIRLKKNITDFSLSTIENSAIFQCRKRAFAFSDGIPPVVQDALSKGYVTRQSVASYEVLQALHPEEWAMPIWDCCAGRGGKTLALAESDFSIALASDVSEKRLHGFISEMKSSGYNIPVVSGSASDVSLWLSEKEEKAQILPLESSKLSRVTLLNGLESSIPSLFGTVLVDAPCSGFGTLSRHPEIRLRRTKKDVQGLVIAQKKILLEAASKVRSGGNLIYITCTLTPEENEQQVASLLTSRPDIKVIRTYTTHHKTLLNEFFYGVCFKIS